MQLHARDFSITRNCGTGAMGLWYWGLSYKPRASGCPPTLTREAFFGDMSHWLCDTDSVHLPL